MQEDLLQRPVEKRGPRSSLKSTFKGQSKERDTRQRTSGGIMYAQKKRRTFRPIGRLQKQAQKQKGPAAKQSLFVKE